MGFLRCYEDFIVVIFRYFQFITVTSIVELGFKSQEDLNFSDVTFEATVALYVPLKDVESDQLILAATADVAFVISVDLKYKLYHVSECQQKIISIEPSRNKRPAANH